MNVPALTPRWPSGAGPKVPDLQTKLPKAENLDMDSALAWLRRELVSLFVSFSCSSFFLQADVVSENG